MFPIFLFILILLLLFGLLLYLLKPSSTEVAVERQLAGIGVPKTGNGENATILKQDTLSSNPLFDLLGKYFPWSVNISRLIQQAGKDWRVGPLLALSLGAAVIGGWLASMLTDSVPAPLATAVGLAIAPYIYLYVQRGIRFRRFDELLPETVDLMARGLRAGHAISAVIEMVGNEIGDPVGSEFRALSKEQSLGLPMREAVNNLVNRMPRDDMRFIATALLLQKESGGNLVQILEKTAAILRERTRLRGQLRIYTAQGRITGWILCCAPFIMFALISMLNRKYEQVLFTEPIGLDMIYVGLAMMVIGVLIIRKIIDIKV